MKRFFTLLLMTLLSSQLSAQNHYIQVEGLQESDSGLIYNMPRTTLVVDVTLLKESVVAGPYARYALKCLGLRAPFSEKVSYSLESAEISLGDNSNIVASNPIEEESESLDYMNPKSGFPELTIDKVDILQPSVESAAEQAAKRIFQLRKSRLELITGEAGEHVFGEGLQVALDEIARQEQELLELFLGKRSVERIVKRIYINPSSDKQQYIISRFSPESGLLAESDLMGEIIMLEITPNYIPTIEEAPLKATETVNCRVAAISQCRVQTAGHELGSATLPIFELGKTVKVVLPRKK